MKYYAVFTVLIVFILLLPGCKEAETSYQEGLQAYVREDYEEAEGKYRLAISQGLDEPYVHADLALACLKLEKTDEALQILNDAYASAPEDPLVLKRVGMFYDAAGDPQTALDFFERSISTPEDAMSVEDLETAGYAARIEMENKNYQEAVRIYDILISQNFYPLPHAILAGECYLKLKQLNAACQYFDMAALQQDVKPEHYIVICRLLKDFGETLEYQQYFQTGLSLCGNGQMSVGEYYADSGLFEEAIGRFDGEDTAGALIAKARCHMEHREYTEAETIFRGLLEKGDSVDRVYNQYMMLEVKREAYTEAFQLLSNVLVSDDETIAADGAWNQVVLYEKTKAYSDAFRCLQDYMAKYPSSPAVKREYAFLSRQVMN